MKKKEEEAVKTLQELWRETNDSWYEEIYSMAIEALEQEPSEDCIDRYAALAEVDPSSYDYKAIKELPSVTPSRATSEWTPVSEPPKENGNYIVSLEDSVYPWGSFFNGKWFMLSVDGIAREFAEYEVRAWKPFPEPYKENEQ